MKPTKEWHAKRKIPRPKITLVVIPLVSIQLSDMKKSGMIMYMPIV